MCVDVRVASRESSLQGPGEGRSLQELGERADESGGRLAFRRLALSGVVGFFRGFGAFFFNIYIYIMGGGSTSCGASNGGGVGLGESSCFLGDFGSPQAKCGFRLFFKPSKKGGWMFN